jgi:hypothetical protein
LDGSDEGSGLDDDSHSDKSEESEEEQSGKNICTVQGFSKGKATIRNLAVKRSTQRAVTKDSDKDLYDPETCRESVYFIERMLNNLFVFQHSPSHLQSRLLMVTTCRFLSRPILHLINYAPWSLRN